MLPLLPLLACAICPACMATYAKILSVLGVGLGLSERQHLILLAVAVGVSVLVSAWRSWRARRLWPFGVAFVGSALVVVGHLHPGLHALEWGGMLALLAGGMTEQLRLSARAPVAPAVIRPRTIHPW